MKTIALRFGEHFSPECGTIAAHQAIIDKLGYVWYGKLGIPVNKKIISEIEKTDHLKDPKQTAILAGILICDELYREKEKSAVLENQLASRMNKTDTEISRITDDLISQIEKVL